MKQLWAPWRIGYVRPKKRYKGCLLCHIAKRKKADRKNLVILRSQLAFCLLNKFPYNNGHIMICPISHKKDLGQLSTEEALDLFELLKQTQALLNKVLSPQGFNVGINLGSRAGAGIDKHLHIHLVPRWKGDTNFMPVISGTKVISESLSELLKNLRKAQNEKK